MKYRKEKNIVRPDMIQMLMEASGMVESDHPKSHNRDWDEVEIAAQCFVFFFAGFENTATVMCLMAHEIMENPSIQEKLLKEISEVEASLSGGELTYEKLKGMRYMDAVLNEVMRKWTSAPFLDRICNKDITYELDNGQKLEIKQGDAVWIPAAGIHNDPKYYANPNDFDPEHFNEEHQDRTQQCTYMPFGIGPRNCIGVFDLSLQTLIIT